MNNIHVELKLVSYLGSKFVVILPCLSMSTM